MAQGTKAYDMQQYTCLHFPCDKSVRKLNLDLHQIYRKGFVNWTLLRSDFSSILTQICD